MAVALDRPQLQGQAGPQGVRGRDHLRARQVRRPDQSIQLEAHQIRDEQKQPAATSRERARSQRQLPDVGHRLDRGPGTIRALLIQTSGKRGESFLSKHFPDGGRAERTVLFLQRLADFVD
jgi:hypothetical protein